MSWPRSWRACPTRATVLIDSLVGLDAAEALLREQDRLRLWQLVHLPLALSLDGTEVRPQEHRALTAATGVITTSGWTRRWLLATYGLEPLHVCTWPGQGLRGGALAAGLLPATLVCVGAVVPDKGHDVLVAALAGLADLPWSCRVVGPLDREPTFVARLQEQVRAAGLTERVQLTGPLSPAEVGAALDTSDLLVLPTLLETFGMVVTEALAHGMPVVASDTGGVAEALGCTA